MERDEAEIRSLLLNSDPEFQTLAEKHEHFEFELEVLAGKRPFTDDDHYREVELKKQKLLLKDRMAQMVRQHLQQEGAAAHG